MSKNNNSKPDFDNQRYKRIEVGPSGKEVGFNEGNSALLDENNNIVARTSFNFNATDGIANQAQAVISLHHVPSGQEEYFKAFITTFSDTLSPSYNEETVFGRTDPIYTFKNTTRNISINWKIPAESYSEAYENLGKVQNIARYVYPNYENINNSLTLTQTPLVRLKVMNLLTKTGTGMEGAFHTFPDSGNNNKTFSNYRSDVSANKGALGVVTSMTIMHNLENFDAGVLYAGPNTVLPKLIEVNMSFNVIHDETLGWVGKNFNQKASGFPYNVVQEIEQDIDLLNQQSNMNQRIAEQQAEARETELAEQARANALARYGTAGGNARFKNDLNRIKRLQNKDSLNERQREKLNYLQSARDGQLALNPDAGEVAGGSRDLADPDLIDS